MNNNIIRYDSINEYDDLKTMKEILIELKKYSNVISKPMYDYLLGALHLDFSILKDYIKKDDRKILSQFNIYSDIFKYNLYYRTINLILDKIQCSIDDDNGVLEIFNKEFKNCLFSFYYGERKKVNYYHYLKRSDCYGYMTIYNLQEANNLTQNEIAVLKNKIKEIENENNPYSLYFNKNTIKKFSYEWETERKKELIKYNEFLKHVEKKQELSNDIKGKISLTNNCFQLLCDDFGLCFEDYEQILFDVENNEYLTDNIDSLDNLVLTKVLTKKESNLVINIETKYIV